MSYDIHKDGSQRTASSLVSRLKKLLGQGMGDKDMTLVRPQSYEVEVFPTSRSLDIKNSLDRKPRLPKAHFFNLTSSNISKHHWPVNSHQTRDKLSQTSSNLG